MTTSEDLEELQMYLAESREHLATIETDLLAMEAAGANINENLVNKVFRAAHSIKGGAGFFGLKKIQELGHKVENVLDLIRSRKIIPNPEIINLFLLSFDCLKGMILDHIGSATQDISELVVALNGLTTSYLPENQKASIRKLKEVKSNTGRVALNISEFDLALVKERDEYVYLVEIDLIHDIHQRGKTPWEVFKTYLACGNVMECQVNFEAVGLLDDDIPNQIPLDLLFSSIIDPSFIHSLFEDISSEKITLIQGPARPQALLKDVSPEPDEVPVSQHEINKLLVANSVQLSPAQPERTKNVQAFSTALSGNLPVPGERPSPAQVSAFPANTAQEFPGALGIKAESGPPSGIEETLRVNVNLLENLMNLAGEMVLSRNQLQNAVQRGDMQAIKSSSQRISLTTSELQETIMLTRMQPIGNILNKFPRVVRDLGNEHNKDIALEIYGKDVEIDKSMLEGLSEPLTHMVRNAVDHGIEDQEQRVKLGKSRTGKIILRAYHAGGQVIVEISDDGKGIDPHQVAQSALKKGLVSEEKLKLMSDAEKRALIFMAGLSTAEKVTDVSGRGVGMDVVKTNLDRLGGKVDIESLPGKGTTFRISLPLTLAIIPSLLVSVNKDRFAIPQMNISELIHINAAQVKTRLEVVGDAEVLVLRDKLIPTLRLADVLGIQSVYKDPANGTVQPERRTRISDRRSKYSDPFNASPIHDESQMTDEERRASSDRRFHTTSGLNIVVINTGVLEYGLVVDELHDTLEIVVRPLGQHLKDCKQYTGASVLGDGRVALILDASGLAANIHLSSLTGSMRAKQLQEQNKLAGATQKDQLALLLFRNAPNECCALPMELVERIEHIQAKQIEKVGNRRTMQYLGRSLPLMTLKDTAQVGEISPTAELVVVVMNLAGRTIGLLAAQPVDVIEAVLAIDTSTHRQKGISGSGIIGKETTLILDVEEMAEAVFGFKPPELVPVVAAKAAKLEQPSIATLGTILLAEDSPFFRNQVTKYLESAGYRVLAAEDGLAGLNLLRQNVANVSLVVTDIEMPNMNGLELTRSIRADKNLAHLPIIALTTLADEDNVAAGKAAGVTAYEIKLDKEKLLQSIRQNLLAI